MATIKKIKMYIPQGTTYIHTFNYQTSDGTNIDLTGYASRLQFRDTVDATATLYDVTDISGELVCGDGTVVLTIDDADCEAFTFDSCVFDLEVESVAGVVTRLVQGTVVLSKEVTR